MEHKMLLVSEPDGLKVSKTGDGRVRIDTTYGGTRLRTLLSDIEAEEVCEALWMATLEARKHFSERHGIG